jgi:hypothetical protein
MRTRLEWEGMFAGREIAGTTILAHNTDGAIESIRCMSVPQGLSSVGALSLKIVV